MTQPSSKGEPESLAWDDVLTLAKECRTLLVASLGAVAFLAISAFSIRDHALLSGDGIVKLPILDAEVPVRVFFFAAPILLAALFAYVHVDMRRTVESTKADTAIPVWPFSELPYRKQKRVRTISWISNLIVWLAWPAISALLLLRVLPLGNPWLGPVNVLSVTGAVTVSAWNFRKVVKLGPAPWWLVASVVAVVMVGVVCTGGVCSGHLRGRALNVNYTDFKSADVVGLDLEGRDLRGANFMRASLSLAKLDGAMLDGARFVGADVEIASFCGASLLNASFRSARAREAKFRCGMQGLESTAVADFTESDLRDVDLTGATVRQLRRADLTSTLLWRANLVGADLSGADLTRTNMAEIDGTAATFVDAKGTQTDFFKAKLTRAQFLRAQLERTNFTSADLTSATLTQAILTGANLDGANLEGANLEGCVLSGADITDTTRLTNATWNRFSVLPAGLDPTGRGMRSVDPPEVRGASAAAD